MTRPWLRLAELFSLWSIGCGALAVAAYMIALNRTGEAFGTLLGILPLVLNRIGNLGQAQVMNNMADALARSQPAKDAE